MIDPTIAVIDRDALRHNLAMIKRTVGANVTVAAVVKADGYGHSASICVEALRGAGVGCFAVASIGEAAALRESGVGERILLFRAPMRRAYDRIVELDVEPFVFTSEAAEGLSRAAIARGRRLDIHVYLDTGMTRNGVEPGELLSLLESVSRCDGLVVRGLASHLATSESADPAFTRHQLSVFDECHRMAIDAGFRFVDVHIANSGGVLLHPESHHTMVRPGIALYGYHPSAELHRTSGLRPVMTLRTAVGATKTVEAGRSVSYGRRYFTPAPATVATLPIGYGDGLVRSLSNRMDVLIGGRRHAVAGTICMDEIVVDLGDAVAGEDDEAVVLGRMGDEQIDAWELASRAGTIPYEILTSISTRVPRIAIGETDAVATRRAADGSLDDASPSH